MDLKKQALVHKYAQALVEKAKSLGQLTIIYEEVSQMIDVFDETKLDAVLTSDKFDKLEKAGLIRRLHHSNSSDLNQMLENLISEDDFGMILPVLQEVLVKIGEETQIFDMEVVAAQPLTQNQKERIRQIVESKFAIKTHHLIETIDQSLIGGFIIKVNNQIIDASVRTQIQDIKQKL
ncbi:F0F1 ATP synthase subunit delta [Streptococcus porci]|uniref:F0F1 ATP synthase subunit delta n=1 Tax=Streptococcus porci TaxID=502567 RepID=UPI0003FFAFE1|nr:F0F1 ATP synthase subunit delta [Streptococcus porci]